MRARALDESDLISTTPRFSASAASQISEEPEAAETPDTGARLLGELSFFALPAPLFQHLTKAAADRQMSLAQLLAAAVSEYLKEPAEPVKK